MSKYSKHLELNFIFLVYLNSTDNPGFTHDNIFIQISTNYHYVYFRILYEKPIYFDEWI